MDLKSIIGIGAVVTDYRKLYCGHYHTRKCIDRMQFMFEDFHVLSERQKK
ncbi:MAG: hypothetical protein IKO68_06755 [Oscillospiraceae bacterium]|nr:hypothetical protein [Oscillospiraceae bacterium]